MCIRDRAEAAGQSKPDTSHIPINELTVREMNVVRYMSGYVASKLTKRCRKKSKNSLVQKKHQMFVAVPKEMVENRSNVEMGSDECIDTDVTLEWTELTDRGGLIHVKAEVRWCIEL